MSKTDPKTGRLRSSRLARKIELAGSFDDGVRRLRLQARRDVPRWQNPNL